MIFLSCCKLKVKWLLVILLICVLTPCLVLKGQYSNPAKVLIINSYHYGFSFSDGEASGVMETLQKEFPDIEIYTEYLDCKYFPAMQHFEKVKDLLKLKYDKKEFSVIIALDDPAIVFLQKYKEELFANTPVVFCGINNFMMPKMKGYTGVFERMDIDDNIKTMLRIHPEANEIVILHDYTISGLSTRYEIEGQIKNLKENVKITYLPNMSFQDLLQKVSTLNKSSLILITAYSKDKDGAFFTQANSTDMISKASKVPVYSAREERLGVGAVGGKMLSGKSHGEFAARIVLEILRGKPVDNIPLFYGSTSVYMFDYNQLKRFKIPIEILPAKSIIINQPESLIEKYSFYFWSVMFAFLLLFCIIILMAFNSKRKKKAESYLRKIEQHFQIALQATHSSSFEEDLAEGKLYVLPVIFQKLGYSENEIPVTISSFHELVHPDDLPSVKKAVENHTKMYADSYYTEYRLKSKTGEWIWHKSEGKIIEYDKDGKPLKLIGLASDISERKNYEQKLMKYNEELRDLNADKDKFFSIIAHDLKSPFLGLLGFSDVLSQNLSELSQEEIKKYANFIHKASKGVYELVEQLLTWSRLQTGRIDFSPRPVKLFNSADSILKALSGSAESKGIEILNNIPADEITFADENMIRTVLHNLIVNAIKFSNKNGEVKISLRHINGFTEVSVKDNGIGIDPEDIDKLFRLDTHISHKGTAGEEGTGLGLVLCKEMIARHNGIIGVESQPGKGSRFYFTLPEQQ